MAHANTTLRASGGSQGHRSWPSPVNADTPASKHLKVLSDSLTPTREVRQNSDAAAASRGISLQEAVHQALETWASEIQKTALEPLDTLEGSLGHVDIENLTRYEREIGDGQREPLGLKCASLVLDAWAVVPLTQSSAACAGRVRRLPRCPSRRRERKLVMNIVNLGEVFYLSMKAKNLIYGEQVL